MRPTLLFPPMICTMICLAACSLSSPPPQPDEALLRQDDWRQKQAAIDAEVIMQGMAQARKRAELLARTAR